MTPTMPEPRTTTQRREHAQAQLQNQHELWLATASEAGPHMIPVNYVWDGEHLTMATIEQSPTVANLRTNHRARIAIGHHADVTMVDGTTTFVAVADIEPAIADAVAQVAHDPRTVPGFVYLRFTPRRAQCWNGFHEFANRTVMRDGAWLD